jgi:hypothetical protein
LFPLHLVSEYGLRRPLGFVVTAAERADLPARLYRFFTFGPEHNGGVLPVGFVEFGFNPSFGAYLFWDDAFFVKANHLRIHFEIWPPDWVSGSVSDQLRLSRRSALELRFTGLDRPDAVFYGIGPSSLLVDQSRYTLELFHVHAAVDARLWRSSRLQLTLGVERIGTGAGHFATDPSVNQVAARGGFPLPFGFGLRTVAPFGRLYASLDTRPLGHPTASGVLVEAQAEQGVDVAHSPISGWLRWGGDITGMVDVNGYGRILSLSAATQFVEQVGSLPIPFSELVSLGGNRWLHGLSGGRLLDRSAAAVELAYRWPISAWLSSTLQVAVGNVFPEHLAQFRPGLLRFSAAVGLRTGKDPPFEMLIGVGTDTFERGGRLEGVRILVGVPHSF